MNKGTTCAHAVDLIPDGASLLIGGFMGVGSPHRVIDELVRHGRKNLTVIANDTGRPVIAATGATLIVAPDVREIPLRT